METRPKFFYAAIVVAAVAVTLFSLIGIAGMTGLLPTAHSSDNETEPAKSLAADNPPVPAPRPAQVPRRQAQAPRRTQPPAQAQIPPREANLPKAAACADCGRIEAVNAVERESDASGLGAVAGGLTGALIGNQLGNGRGRTAMTIVGGAGGAYLGNQIEQNARRTTAYRIKVRMEDGTLRTFDRNEAPNLKVGERVKIVDEAIVPSS